MQGKQLDKKVKQQMIDIILLALLTTYILLLFHVISLKKMNIEITKGQIKIKKKDEVILISVNRKAYKKSDDNYFDMMKDTLFWQQQE